MRAFSLLVLLLALGGCDLFGGEPTTVAEGVVVDAMTGEPVERIDVRLIYGGGFAVYPTAARTRTDASGRFRLSTTVDPSGQSALSVTVNDCGYGDDGCTYDSRYGGGIVDGIEIGEEMTDLVYELQPGPDYPEPQP